MPSKSSFLQFLKDQLTGKQIAIVGSAREGNSTLKLLSTILPADNLKLLDEHDDSAAFAHLDQYDVLIKSPGVPSDHPGVVKALKAGKKLSSQTELFFQHFRDQVVAVTGTKGKSTTSSVIEQVLCLCGKEVLLIGNIGAPAFDHLDEITDTSIIVYESSSHQCREVTVSPHMAVWTNLFQDHLDYYHTMDAYKKAKLNLFRHQKSDDLAFYNASDPVVSNASREFTGTKVGYGLQAGRGVSAWLEKDWIMAIVNGKPQPIIATAAVPLLGAHNWLNVMPAILVALQYGCPAEQIAQALHTIKPVAGRLETVGNVNGVTFIDDALATIPEATIAAIHAIPEIETLIVGGFDRGQHFEKLADEIAKSGIRHLILFPTTGEKVAQLVSARNSDITANSASSMMEAVELAFKLTSPGRAVVLSTAAPSFGLFADYRDRSQQYQTCIHSHQNPPDGDSSPSSSR